MNFKDLQFLHLPIHGESAKIINLTYLFFGIGSILTKMYTWLHVSPTQKSYRSCFSSASLEQFPQSYLNGYLSKTLNKTDTRSSYVVRFPLSWNTQKGQ